MNPLSLFGYTALTLVILAVTLATILALTNWSRALLHHVAIDLVEILARFNQMIIDRDRQRVELEVRQDRHAARLEAWQQRARIRLTEERQKMIAGEGQ